MAETTNLRNNGSTGTQMLANESHTQGGGGAKATWTVAFDQDQGMALRAESIGGISTLKDKLTKDKLNRSPVSSFHGATRPHLAKRPFGKKRQQDRLRGDEQKKRKTWREIAGTKWSRLVTVAVVLALTIAPSFPHPQNCSDSATGFATEAGGNSFGQGVGGGGWGAGSEEVTSGFVSSPWFSAQAFSTTFIS